MNSLKDLLKKQALPLDQKIEMSQCLIETWWKHWDSNVYIAFSGGKDSTVLLHLVRSLFPEIIAVYSDTGLEYPEIKSFIKTFDNIKIIRPKYSFREVIEKWGYAVISKEQASFIYDIRNTKSESLKNTRLNGNEWDRGKLSSRNKYLLNAPFKISDKCCDILKKDPFKKYEKDTNQKPFLGILANESILRRSNWIKYGCNAFELKRPTSSPLSFWTDQDILQYLINNNLKIASVYGDIENKKGILSLSGLERTGCVWCLFGIDRELKPNRFQMLKSTHPKLYEYALYDLKIKEVLDFMGIEY